MKTLKNVPLVPFNPDYPKAVRYRISGVRADGTRECERDNDGDYMTHFTDCPGAKDFSKGRKR
jgi:hypothetical protein